MGVGKCNCPLDNSAGGPFVTMQEIFFIGHHRQKRAVVSDHVSAALRIGIKLSMDLEHLVEVFISSPQGKVHCRVAKEDHFNVNIDMIRLECIQLELIVRGLNL